MSPFLTGNFKRVKEGKLDSYTMKQYQSKVVADEFRYGSSKNVVVALENDVMMVNKREMKKVSMRLIRPQTTSLITRFSPRENLSLRL